MRDIVNDVLMYMETGLIDSFWLATNFEGRQSLVREDFNEKFVSELDLQEQIDETELTWNEED